MGELSDKFGAGDVAQVVDCLLCECLPALQA
jgi:hypothetical protein